MHNPRLIKTNHGLNLFVDIQMFKRAYKYLLFNIYIQLFSF